MDQNLGTEKEDAYLAWRLSTLSLPADRCQPYGDRAAFTGEYRVTEGELEFDVASGGIMQACFPVHPVDELTLSFTEELLELRCHTSLGWNTIEAGLDGMPRLNHVPTPPYPCDKLLATASFDGDELVLAVRWPETCYNAKVTFTLTQDGLATKKQFADVDPLGQLGVREARAVRK